MDCTSQKGHFPYSKGRKHIAESTPSIPALRLNSAQSLTRVFEADFNPQNVQTYFISPVLPHSASFAPLLSACFPPYIALISGLSLKNQRLSGTDHILQVVFHSHYILLTPLEKLEYQQQRRFKEEHFNNLYISDKVICSQNRG